MVGFRGQVLLAFEENGSSKVGVRFDKCIPEGTDLGGLCEEDHGFFCTGDSLKPPFTYIYILILLLVVMCGFYLIMFCLYS